MSEQTLLALIQLMGSMIGTEGIEPEDKKVAQNILSKALVLIEKNVVYVYNREVTKIAL